ncbi:MAG: molybdopterin-guanine dinucleotide biosynthesis protein B [Salinirussus sp.]
MYAVRIVGPSGTGKTTLVERLTERLSERGRVGTIKHLDCRPDLDTEGKDTARHRAAGATTTYGIATSGEWFATGTDCDLGEGLNRLADTCDYAIVEGYSGSGLALPTVVLGDVPAPEGAPVIASASTAAAVDFDATVAAIERAGPVEGRA